MSIDLNDEILQDFLVEAGEILEQLNEDLVELEQSSGDADILNTVFRGFHTIKGGAGFLSLTALVDVCHRAEDVFDVLRKGEREVDAELMDIVLTVIDVVNTMFSQVQEGEDPTPAEKSLLDHLEVLARPASQAKLAESEKGTGDQTDKDFEAMLDGSSATSPEKPEGVNGSNDAITEDEFEALLDDLHGKGSTNSQSTKIDATKNTDITEDEFDALLDQLHGKGEGPIAKKQVSGTEDVVVAAPEKIEAKPAIKPKKEVTTTAKPKQEATVRVDTSRLDDIMNMVGELVLVRNRLTTLKDALSNESLDQAVSNLDVVTADLQSAVMKTRMQPVKKVFGRFPRVVRDLARTLNKEINLIMVGEETDLDKNLVEALADPLVHLVRNAVDHGIEMPEERLAAGKSSDGTITLSASQEGDHIQLFIDDDGKGMDPNVLRQKAIDKGLMDEDAAARLTDNDCFNLIFHAGLSTKEQISDVSGRGVGMDVVKTKISALNGTVDVNSELGKGSRLTIRVPLTLAIMPTLMVTLGGQPFALPLGSVSEIFEMEEDNTNVLDGQKVVMVRDQPLPIHFLRDWLVQDSSAPRSESTGHVVVVHIGSQSIGFVVEQLIGQEEVVIKPLGAFLQGLPSFAGATITGDGRIALILDVPGLLKSNARSY
ncbi:MAG: chemotaxis protein CheA [Gammaproteobacteria bacterium]